jgi:NAD(P)H-dependent nitrite reductase small subunit
MPYVDTLIKLEEMSVGESRLVKVGDAQIGLFRQADGLFAIDNLCPHRGAPLHEGFVTDDYVTCPWHQWQFQLGDGVCRNIPKVRIATYPVEVRDGTIWIDTKPEAKS